MFYLIDVFHIPALLLPLQMLLVVSVELTVKCFQIGLVYFKNLRGAEEFIASFTNHLLLCVEMTMKYLVGCCTADAYSMLHLEQMNID